MKWIILSLGVAGVLLGGLWLLQGLEIVHIQPILCGAKGRCRRVGESA
jgi:hypothetical protein